MLSPRLIAFCVSSLFWPMLASAASEKVKQLVEADFP